MKRQDCAYTAYGSEQRGRSPSILTLSTQAFPASAPPSLQGNSTVEIIARNTPQTPMGEADIIVGYEPQKGVHNVYKLFQADPPIQRRYSDPIEELLAVTGAATRTAANDRFAEAIFNETGLVNSINFRAGFLRGRAAREYSYPALREEMVGCEYLCQPEPLWGFCRWVGEAARNQTAPPVRYSDLPMVEAKVISLYRAFYNDYVQRPYRGGMARLINELFSRASRYLAPENVLMPSKALAEVTKFGKELDSTTTQLPDGTPLAGRVFMVTERVRPLSRHIADAYQRAAREAGIDVSTLVLNGIRDVAKLKPIQVIYDDKYHPDRAFKEWHLIIDGLNALGLVFVDNNTSQAGFDERGRLVIYDPTSIVRNGSRVFTINLQFAPAWARKDFERQRLTASPRLDQEMIAAIEADIRNGIVIRTYLDAGSSVEEIQDRRRTRLAQASQRYIDLSEG